MKAKKSFGQHFLNRPDIAQRIAQGLTKHAETDNRVLEIGPGQGMLTEYLLAEKYDLKCVEADRDMVGILQKKYPPLSTNILLEDFLDTDLEKVFEGKSFCLIGNFPYNISSQILIKMVENRHLIPEMVGMFQKEVADRVVSKEGSKTYGVISVLIQAFYEGKTIIDVDKSCFTPPPKVQSSVIRLVRKPDTEGGLGCDEKLFRRVVKQSFGQRRKMLRNTLKGMLPDTVLSTEVFFTKRPEQLSLADFVALTKRIAAQTAE